MAFASADSTEGSDRLTRSCGLIAIVLLVCFAAWRFSDMRAAHDISEPATLIDARLTHLIEPIIGQGQARIVLNHTESGHKALLLVVNGASVEAPETFATIQRVLINGANLDVAAGDTLTIEQLPFVTGTDGHLSAKNFAELGALGVLISLLGWMLIRLARPQSAMRSSKMESVANPSSVVPACRENIKPAKPVTASNGLAESVKKDPAAAAAIVRNWMRGAA